MIEVLPWDSEFFGHRIARLKAFDDTVEEECRSQQIACLYLCIPLEQAPLAERLGAALVDVRTTYEGAARPGLNGDVRLVVPQDVARLQQIAREAHRHTRYYADPRFDRARSDDLYALWIEKSCNGWADAVLVSGDEGDPQGYVTCHLDGTRIGLVSVAAESRGHGLGKTLLHGALDWFSRHGRRRVHVVTQGGNVAGQRLYQSCGFRITGLELYYHKWFV